MIFVGIIESFFAIQNPKLQYYRLPDMIAKNKYLEIVGIGGKYDTIMASSFSRHDKHKIVF